MNLKQIANTLIRCDLYLQDYITTSTYRGETRDIPPYEEHILDAETHLYESIMSLTTALRYTPTYFNESEVIDHVECV